MKPNGDEEQAEEPALAKREILKLRADMRRLEEERDILKKAARYFAKDPGVKYRFILEHRHELRVLTMCRVLRVHPSGYYQWIQKPLSDRAIEDQRLLTIIRSSYAASGGVYRVRRVFLDLREMGETRGVHRVAKIMQVNKIKALRGYKAPRQIAGRPSIIAPNELQREFTVELPNRAWQTDITYIRTIHRTRRPDDGRMAAPSEATSHRTFCSGCPGSMFSMLMPKRNHHTDSLLRA